MSSSLFEQVSKDMSKHFINFFDSLTLDARLFCFRVSHISCHIASAVYRIVTYLETACIVRQLP